MNYFQNKQRRFIDKLFYFVKAILDHTPADKWFPFMDADNLEEDDYEALSLMPIGTYVDKHGNYSEYAIVAIRKTKDGKIQCRGVDKDMEMKDRIFDFTGGAEAQIDVNNMILIADLLDNITDKSDEEIKAMKSFVYNGMKFRAIRKFTESERDKDLNYQTSSLSPRVSNYGNESNWNYNDFYKAAQRAGAQHFDVFDLKGQEVVPGENELFLLK